MLTRGRADCYVFFEGGLGDQLNRLSRVIDLNEARGPRLKIVCNLDATSQYGRSTIFQSASLRDLEFQLLPAQLVFPERTGQTVGSLWFRAYRWALVRLLPVARRLTEILQNTFPRVGGVVYFGQESSLPANSIESRVISRRLGPINPTSSSADYLELRQAQTRSQVVGVHYRISDFVTFRGGVHYLAPHYYLTAIEALKRRLGDCEIWLFSDDVPTAKENLGSITNLFIPAEGKNLSTVEELFLLSSCSGLVLSNSQFSKWARYCSSLPDSLVVDPWGV